MGSELEADWLERVAALLERGWAWLVEKKPESPNTAPSSPRLPPR